MSIRHARPIEAGSQGVGRYEPQAVEIRAATPMLAELVFPTPGRRFDRRVRSRGTSDASRESIAADIRARGRGRPHDRSAAGATGTVVDVRGPADC